MVNSINTNIAALFAQSSLNRAQSVVDTSVARLSSGNRIIRASDDVAALAIGTGLSTDVTTLRTALQSATNGITVTTIADAALGEIATILERQKSLASSANDGSLSDTERGFLNQEFQALSAEIDRIAGAVNFNGVALIDGSLSGASGLNSLVADDATDFSTSGATGTTALSDADGFNLTSGVDNNVIGSLANAEVSISRASATSFTVFLTLNGSTYSSAVVNLNNAAGIALTDAATGAVITLDIQADGGLGADIDNNTEAAAVAAAIEADLAGVTVYQERTFATDTDGNPSNAFDELAVIGTVLDGFTGASFQLTSSDFNTTTNAVPALGAFTVVQEDAAAGIDGRIEVTIGGEVFRTVAGTFDGAATDLDGTGLITLTNVNNSSEALIINFANSTNNIDLATVQDAAALQSALNAGFGAGSSGGLSFSVGVAATDTISVTIDGATTAALYRNSDGNPVSLDISTASGAATAGTTLDIAINALTTIRSGVGASQSRLNFASRIVETSIQNTEGARSSFLDADIASEATTFASTQVRVQASISVLAQANQLPQNLLKLIG